MLKFKLEASFLVGNGSFTFNFIPSLELHARSKVEGEYRFKATHLELLWLLWSVSIEVNYKFKKLL